MKRITIAILVTTLLLFAMLTVLAETARERTGEEHAVRTGSLSASDLTVYPVFEVEVLSPTVDGPTEFWRLGVTSEDGAAYSAAQGRLVHPAATFRSSQDTMDAYYIFPAPSAQRIVQAAKCYILDRTGTYEGFAMLTLEILDYTGAVQRTVSAAPINMRTASTSAWITIALSGNPTDLEIEPGEFLAFHFDASLASSAGLRITKSVTPDVAAPGSAITYTLAVFVYRVKRAGSHLWCPGLGRAATKPCRFSHQVQSLRL